jgi:cytochrome oxidase Cu insertion factor (SCO1/SenC/PrrC family)
VLINFVFTQCGDTCPLITAQLVQVRKELGEAFGRDVRFARKFVALHPEWWFLTAKKRTWIRW